MSSLGSAESGVLEIESEELLQDFVAYCVAHPSERFWQALRNWSGYNFIIAQDGISPNGDTFYWTSKDGK